MTITVPLRRRNVAQVIEAVNEVQRRLRANRPEPFPGHRLGSSHMDVLFVLARRERCTPSDLAARLQITPGAVTQLVTRLREAALVVSTRHPHDSRSVILTLTEEARVHVASWESRVLDGTMPMFEALSDGDIAILAALLKQTAGGTNTLG